MKTCRWLLLGTLLMLGNVAHAEGGCPPGMIPASGTDINSCVPIPPGYNNNPQQAQPRPPQLPPQQWEDQWGAIATYEPNGSLGTATEMPSQSSAERAALADCQSKHGSTCKIQLSYRNQCAAMVVSDKGYNVTPAATVDLAVTKGMAICTKSGDPNCHVYYSACSPAVRIQ
jgi:hypothetical protein